MLDPNAIPVTLFEGGQQGDRRSHARLEIDDWSPQLRGRTVRFTGDVERASRSLDREIVRCRISFGSSHAESGDPAVDDSRVDGFESVPCEIELLCAPKTHVLDDDIRSSGESVHDRCGFGSSKVDGDAHLGAIQSEVRHAQPVEFRRAAPGGVLTEPSRPLDLDDRGAQIGEEHGRERPCHGAAEVEYRDSGQRTFCHLILPSVESHPVVKAQWREVMRQCSLIRWRRSRPAGCTSGGRH